MVHGENNSDTRKSEKRPLLENDTEKERVIAGLQRQVDEQRLKNKEMEAQFKVPAGHRQGISLELQEILDNFRSPTWSEEISRNFRFGRIR